MRLNDIGKILSTNSVSINGENVTKRFNQFSLPMLWGMLERKPFSSARERYKREKRLIELFAQKDCLNTPDLISFNDNDLVLVFKTLPLTDLVQIFQNPEIHIDEKLQYLKRAFEQLYAIHEFDESHGDPYLKNFFRIGDSTSIYTCDFEYERTGVAPAIMDVLLLTANSIQTLLQTGGPEQVFSVFEEVYGNEIHFPFDVRDMAFFSLRFGMRKVFFDYFRTKSKTFT